MTIANYITLFRLFLVAVIVPLIYQKTADAYMLASILFVFALISDWLDGFIARRFDQISELGAILDPLVDKVLIYVVLFSLLHMSAIDPVLIFLMFARDMIVDSLRNRAAVDNNVLSANMWGKAKFTFQSSSVLCSLAFCISAQTEFLDWANAALLAAIIISIPGVIVIASTFRENTGMTGTQPSLLFENRAVTDS